MKTKYKIILQKDALKWYNISNCFAKSLYPFSDAVKQFNKLSINDRNNIRRLYSKYDEIRRNKIPNGESDAAWLTCVMVDSNIIATEFDIDPLTAVMCINPPCKINEKIVIK